MEGIMQVDETIYTIISIDEDDYGCEDRADNYIPLVRVLLKDSDGESEVVMMEDSLMYARKLDTGDKAVIGIDGTLYAPGHEFGIEDISEVCFDRDKQAEWMENYYDAIDEMLEEEGHI